MGRLGVATDVASVDLYLASDHSYYVTGTTSHTDGGCLAAGPWSRTTSGKFTSAPIGLDQL